MKTTTQNIIRNQSGMNLISVIGTVAVLGVGLVAALQLTKMSDTGRDSASRKIDASSMTSIVENKLKSAFFDTKGSDSKLNSGLCSLIQVASLDTQLSNVYIQLPATNKDSLFDKSIWAKAFKGLKEVSPGKGCNLESSYGKCFKFDENVDASIGVSKGILSKLDPLFEVNIRPMVTNPAADVTFGKLVPDGVSKYDLKAIGFEYTIRASYNSTTEDMDKKMGRRFIQGFIWAGDIGICEIGNKKISLTANSFGDPSNSTVFNQAGFSSDSKSRNTATPLEVTLLNSQIRSGILGGTLGSQFLLSRDSASAEDPDSGPVYSACNESQFRCPQLNSQDRNYQFMRHMIRARYQVPNRLSNAGNNVQISAMVKFKNLREQFLPQNYSESFNLSGRNYNKSDDGWYYAQVGDDKIPLRIGEESSVIARLSDSPNGIHANEVCRRICVPETNFNSSTNDHYTSIFSYKVKMGNIPRGETDTFEVSSGPVACTSCNMKNCDQFGLGTFGAMHAQPTEPLDAGVPECVRHEAHANNIYETSNFDLGSSSANKCVSARLRSGDNSGLALMAQSCDTELPVICFAYGKHMLARNITLSSSSVIKKNFNNAYESCFELGKENIKKEPFRTLLSQQGNLNSTEMELLGITDPNLEIDLNQRMEVMNFVNQGSFFAPVGLNQEINLRQLADKQGEKPQLISNDSWVGLKTDNLGYIYAPAPRLATAALNANSKWGIHYDGNGRMVVKKTSDGLNLNSSTESDTDDLGKKVGLLFHSPRYKGVHLVKSFKPYGERDSQSLRVLCRKNWYPHELFVANKRTTHFKHAENICKDENGAFLPPLTTAGWASAYQLVHANHAKHPFPDIWSPSELDPVWVNVVENGSSQSIYMGKVLSGSMSKFINSQGEFVTETFKPGAVISDQEKDNHDFACFNKDKGEINFRHICSSGSRPLTQEEVASAVHQDNMYLRFMLKIALASRSGYGNIKLYQ